VCEGVRKAQIIPHLINLGHPFVRPLLDMVHRAADSIDQLSAVSSAVGGTGFGKGVREGEKNGDLAGSAAIFLPSKEIWPPSLAGWRGDQRDQI